MTSDKRRYVHHLLALSGYLALTLLMTYPLAREFGEAIPGDGFDGWQNVWNLWWVKRALLVEGTHPYFTRLVDYPVGVYLYFHTLNIFNGLAFLPFTLNNGPLVAYNVAVLFSFMVGGYGAYLLALHMIRQERAARFAAWRNARLAAFLGGVVFAFSPYHMAHLLGHMQLISLEWLPFSALFAIKQISKSASSPKGTYGLQISKSAPANLSFFVSHNLRYILLAALFLVLVAMCDWYYAFYMALFTGLYLVWTVWQRRAWLAPALGAVATGLIFVAATSPVLVPMVRESLRSDYMLPPPGSIQDLSADVTAFFTPSELHPLWGEWAAGWAGRFTASTSERTVFAGYSVLALALLALVTQWRAARFWGLSALTFAVLALGPVLHIGGQTRFGGVGPIPLPYGVLHRALPLLKISRSVSRFDVVVMLSLGVLAAIGLNWLLNRGRRPGYNVGIAWLMAAGAIAVVALEFWVAPYPMSLPETQPFHYRLAQDPKPFAVMDIPMDWDRPANLLYQTVHQKPMVSGYTSRTNPMSPAWRTPVLQTFRYLGPDINSRDARVLAATVLNDLDVGYVIVHKTDLPPGEYRDMTLALADEIFAGWPVVFNDDWLKVFQVVPVVTVQPYLVLGEGWAPREWHAGRPARTLAGAMADLLAHSPGTGLVRLELDVYSAGGPASLEVDLGGRTLGSYVVGQEEMTITVPTLSLPVGESRIQLRSDSAPGSLVVTGVRLIPDR